MPRLLLVDDDISEISAVKRVLSRSGLAPLLATSGPDALASIGQARPDLMLLGSTCQGGEALAAIRQLDEDEATRGIPLIILGEVAGAPAGAVQLPRPVDPAALSEQVKQFLSSAPVATPFERRVSAPELPSSMDRRSGPSDPALARKAAAEALLARAKQLRSRGRAPVSEPPVAAQPAPAEAAAGLDALFELEPPAGVGGPPEPSAEPPIDLPLPPLDLDLDFSGLGGQAGAPAERAAPELAAPASTGARASRPSSKSPPAVTPTAVARVALTRVAQQRVIIPPPAPDLVAPSLVAPDLVEPEPVVRRQPPPAQAAPAQAARSRPAPAAAPAPAAPAQAERPRAARPPAAPSPVSATAPPGPAAPTPVVPAPAGRTRVASATAASPGTPAAPAPAAPAAPATPAQVATPPAPAAARAPATRAPAVHLEAPASAPAPSRASAPEPPAPVPSWTSAPEPPAPAAPAVAERAPAPPAPPAQAAPSPELERAHAEAQAARRALEEELRAVRAQLEADRRKHDEELLTVIERASAHEQAALADFQARAVASAAQAPTPPAEAPAPLFADVPPLDPAQASARRRALSHRAPAEAGEAEASEREPAPPADTWARPGLEEPPAELRSGRLDDLPMPRLLATAWKARAGGRLEVSGEASRALWFEDGRVVGATSNAAGERLDEVALRLGLLTRDQHRQVAGAAAGLATRRAAVLLVDRGYLKSGELTPLVRARTEEVVFGIFGETNARFRWVTSPVPADERIALERPPLALAVEGVRRRWLAHRLELVLGGPATLVSPIFGGPTDEELRLQAEERRALAGADGLRTLDEVLALSPLDALSTRQLLAALVLVGALSIKVVQAGRPAAQVSAVIDLARVKEKLEQVRRSDYFTILGLGRVATPHEVRAAAERLTAEYQAERFRGHQEEGLPARLEEIRRVVADAREVLADPILREEYERGLAS